MMFWRKHKNEETKDSFEQATEVERRLIMKQREAHERDPEVKAVVKKLKKEAGINHFGQDMLISFGGRRGE